MKLLVTGGAGFIGSNFIRYWLSKHHTDKIINLDNLTYSGHISSTNDFLANSNYKFIKGDICDKKIVDSVMDGVDIVVHFAAESHVDRSIQNPQVFFNTNIMGTGVLLNAALKHRIKKFHHVSTDEVYGSLNLNSTNKFKEDSLYCPRSPYAASKASSDHLVRSYYYTYGLPITITNCSNNYGPFQDPEKFIPRAITNLIEKKDVILYGDGLYVRDWLHVVDHCRAIESVLTQGCVGETYMVGGSTDNINHIAIANKLLSIFNITTNRIKFVNDRAGHDRKYSVDWSKIKDKLGWTPQYDFDNWLIRTVDWYKNNEKWWKPLKSVSEKFYLKAKQI